jgi:hypothetical protein
MALKNMQRKQTEELEDTSKPTSRLVLSHKYSR